MMRGASNWAVAVRKPDGDIVEVHQPIEAEFADDFNAPEGRHEVGAVDQAVVPGTDHDRVVGPVGGLHAGASPRGGSR